MPSKPDDPNDPLTLMWWDLTLADFKTFDAGVVDGLGEMKRSKFLLLWGLMMNLESRINDFQKATPNLFLSSMAKSMQDACQWLGSLKTTYSQMRFGLAEFQRYYLEVLGFLTTWRFINHAWIGRSLQQKPSRIEPGAMTTPTRDLVVNAFDLHNCHSQPWSNFRQCGRVPEMATQSPFCAREERHME